jgi:DNA repair protein RecO (recombination protein O)
MSLVRDRCICLRKTEYSETSQVLTLLSRSSGIVRAIAKGAHRRTKAGASKFDGGVDLLDVGEAVLIHAPERELGTLCEWHLSEGHLVLRRNLRAIYLGLYSAELIGMFFEEHDPHVELFDRLEALLCDLASTRIEESFLSFQLDLLREAGYLPEMSGCVMCGNEMSERAYFSPAHSGLVCRNCEQTAPDRMEIDPRLVRMVQGILRLPRSNGSPPRLPQLTRYQTDPINKLLAEHVEHTLSRRLRMPKWVLASIASRASSASSA